MSTTYTLTCGHSARAATGLPEGRRLHCVACPPDGEHRLPTFPIAKVLGSGLTGGDPEAWLAGMVEEYLREIAANLDDLADDIRREVRRLHRMDGSGSAAYTEVAASITSKLTNRVNNLPLSPLAKRAAEADVARAIKGAEQARDLT